MVRILIISDIHLWSLPNEHDQFYPIRRKLLEDIKDYTAHPTNPVEGCADANPKTMLPNDT